VNRTAERVARNDATFRAANEEIAQSAAGMDLERMPVICECAEERCTAIVRITPAEYETVRADPTHFINAPGHESNAGPHAVVVERKDGYVVVQKVGDAAAIVKELR